MIEIVELYSCVASDATMDNCLDEGTGVVEGALMNLSFCMIINLTWDYFLRYIVHGLV